MKRPAFQFYPADWRKDAALQSCSMAAQGLWMNILCIAHECEPYGHLTINGRPLRGPQIARLVGLTPGECEALLKELLNAGVAAVAEDESFFSRRMVRDEALRETRAASGRLGGNPALLKQRDKQDAKQAPTPSSSSSSSKERDARATRLPAPFVLDETWAAWAKSERPDLNPAATAAKFADHWHSKPGKDGVKLDWFATWRNWVRAERMNPADVARVTVPGPKPTTFLAEQAAHRAQVEAERIARKQREAA